MFVGPFDTSMLKKAKDAGAVEINIHDLRAWSTDRHKTVDDRPFGGGKGMVLKIEPIFEALEELKNQKSKVKSQNLKLKIKKFYYFKNPSPSYSSPSKGRGKLKMKRTGIFSTKC